MGLRGAAFWLFPDGTVRTVATSHVDELIRAPAAFGWTRTEIDAAYARHGEPLGWEGFAREELIRETVRRGFVRVREHVGRGRCRWSVTVGPLDDATRALIAGWLVRLVPAWKRGMPAKVMVIDGGTIVAYVTLAGVVGSRAPEACGHG